MVRVTLIIEKKRQAKFHRLHRNELAEEGTLEEVGHLFQRCQKVRVLPLFKAKQSHQEVG